MSLLQDVLRHQTLDSIERRFDTPHPDSDNSDDELVNVVRPHSSHVCGPRLTHRVDVHTRYTFIVSPSDQAGVAITRNGLETQYWQTVQSPGSWRPPQGIPYTSISENLWVFGHFRPCKVRSGVQEVVLKPVHQLW